MALAPCHPPPKMSPHPHFCHPLPLPCLGTYSTLISADVGRKGLMGGRGRRACPQMAPKTPPPPVTTVSPKCDIPPKLWGVPNPPQCP